MKNEEELTTKAKMMMMIMKKCMDERMAGCKKRSLNERGAQMNKSF